MFFQARLTFEAKASSLSIEWNTVRCSIMVGSYLIRKYQTYLKTPLAYFASPCVTMKKKLYNIGTWLERMGDKEIYAAKVFCHIILFWYYFRLL
jgi:hypothetical protein